MPSLFDHLNDISVEDLLKELQKGKPREEYLQKCCDFLQVCVEKDIYDQKKMEALLPFVHDRIVHGSTDWASRLLYDAISNNDLDFVEKILSYPQVSLHPNGDRKDGIEGWVSYLEHHVYRYDGVPPCPNIAYRLAKHFGDNDGMALLRCVQHNLKECFDIILPFSNIQAEHYFIYHASACAPSSYFIEKIEPLCNKMEALLGLKYEFPYHDPNEKDNINQSIALLEKSITSSPKTIPEHLYVLLKCSNDSSFIELFQKNHQTLSSHETQLLLHTSIDGEHHCISTLILESVKEVPSRILIKLIPQKDLLSLALQKTTEEAKQNLLWILCRDKTQDKFKSPTDHLNTVFMVLKSGVNTAQLLSSMEHVAYSSLLPKRKPQRLKEVENLKIFCALYEKHLIQNAIVVTEKTKPPQKM